MKKIGFLILSVLLLLTTACAFAGAEPAILESYDMEYVAADNAGIEVIAFDFGEGELKNSIGDPVPCPLDGIIAAPDGEGPYPLVVIFHGVAPIIDNYDKTYAGFDYLVKQLAAEGYVALSFNITAEHNCFEYGESLNHEWAYTIYLQQLTLLERANSGDNPGYGIDLTGKIDFDNIHFIGHSRGGEIADSFIRDERALGNNRVKSLIRVEATAAHYPDGDPHPDVPIGIIIGEFDGDVPEDGQTVFDDIQNEIERTTPASIVSLRGANHAYFSRAFLTEDHLKYGAICEGKLLDREAQEDFLTHYAAAFLSVYAKGEAPWGIWDNSATAPDSMFGYAVTASNYVPGRETLLAVSEAEAAKLTTSGAAEISYAVQTAPYGILYAHPGATLGERTLALINIRWSEKGGAVSIPCEADLTSGAALSIYAAIDSSDALNVEGASQSFTITLKDKSGVAQTILIPTETSALAYYPGFIDHYDATEWSPEFDVWVGFMPQGEIRIPLNYFGEINMSAIAEITIALDQTDSGSAMLSGVYLEK